MRTRARTIGSLAAAGAVGAVVAVGVATAAGRFGSTTTIREVAPETVVQPDPASFARATKPLTIHDVYVRDAPGVVQVTARGHGSGFVIDKAGHIVTNYHVVQGASRVTVSFSNQERLPATVVGRDPASDLAVLQVHLTSRALTPLPLGDSDLVRVGDSVVAIGNPLGEDRSVTVGIVSALERRIDAPVDRAIQTDAVLDRADAGGPLLNARGQVIGLTESDGTNGIGFAIPADTVKTVVAQLVAKGYVEHPFVGIQARAITPPAAALFRLPVEHGLLVSSVCARTGAARAGLRGAKQEVTVAGSTWPLGGDIVVKADGMPVGSVDALRQVVSQKKPGQSVALEILRGDKPAVVNVTLGRQPLSARC